MDLYLAFHSFSLIYQHLIHNFRHSSIKDGEEVKTITIGFPFLRKERCSGVREAEFALRPLVESSTPEVCLLASYAPLGR